MPRDVLAAVFKTESYESLADYKALVDHLDAYQKAGDLRSWDVYSAKIPEALRKQWSEVLSECRRNGFIAPYAYDKKMIWRQIRTHGPMTDDLCTLCDKECKTREMIDSGDAKWRTANIKGWREPKKCWEVGQ